MPEPRPSVNIATTTAISRATSGVPEQVEHPAQRVGGVLDEDVHRALPIISATGSRTLNMVTPNDGRRPASLSREVEGVRGRDVDPPAGEPAEQRPDTITVGGHQHAEGQREAEVAPR